MNRDLEALDAAVEWATASAAGICLLAFRPTRRVTPDVRERILASLSAIITEAETIASAARRLAEKYQTPETKP